MFKVRGMSLGKQVKFYREKLKLTLEQLEDASGVGSGTISALEVRDSVRSKYAPALAAAFGLTVDQLLDESRDWLEVDRVPQQPESHGVKTLSDKAAASLWKDYQNADKAAQLVVDMVLGRKPIVEDVLGHTIKTALAAATEKFPATDKPAKSRKAASIS